MRKFVVRSFALHKVLKVNKYVFNYLKIWDWVSLSFCAVMFSSIADGHSLSITTIILVGVFVGIGVGIPKYFKSNPVKVSELTTAQRWSMFIKLDDSNSLHTVSLKDSKVLQKSYEEIEDILNDYSQKNYNLKALIPQALFVICIILAIILI